MKLQDVSELSNIDTTNCIVIRISGLYGDLLHASTRFQGILQRYPNANWIIIHSYAIKERVETCLELFKTWEIAGRLKYYLYDHYTRSSGMQSAIRSKLNSIGISDDKIFDCFVFQRKPSIITPPNIGINIPPEKNPNKAIIFRYSGWHRHFPKRNRPIEEWNQIEQYLLKSGYIVHLLGYDDILPVNNNITDWRKKFTIRECLDFSKDASICITTTTFLYVWMQFICPTMVLCDAGDVQGLNRYWKLNSNMRIANVNMPSYLNQTFTFIDSVKTLGTTHGAQYVNQDTCSYNLS